MILKIFLTLILITITASAGSIIALDILFPVNLHIDLECHNPGSVQVFWDTGNGFNESESFSFTVRSSVSQHLSTRIPSGLKSLRIDFPGKPGLVRILNIRASRIIMLAHWSSMSFWDWQPLHDIHSFVVKNGILEVQTGGIDPYMASRKACKKLRNALWFERIIIGVLSAIVTAIVSLRIILRSLTLSERNSLEYQLFRKIGLAIASTVVFGAIGYAVLVFFFPKQGGYYIGQGSGYSLSFLDDRGKRISTETGPLGLMFDPLTFYRTYPNHYSDKFTIDENGFRGGILDVYKPKVIILGGSAAFGYGLPSDDMTFSARLNHLVDKYTFVNAATVGYASGQELSLMIHYLDRFRPDIYIVFNGWNDLIPMETDRICVGVNGQHLVLRIVVSNPLFTQCR